MRKRSYPTTFVVMDDIVDWGWKAAMQNMKRCGKICSLNRPVSIYSEENFKTL